MSWITSEKGVAMEREKQRGAVVGKETKVLGAGGSIQLIRGTRELRNGGNNESSILSSCIVVCSVSTAINCALSRS